MFCFLWVPSQCAPKGSSFEASDTQNCDLCYNWPTPANANGSVIVSINSDPDATAEFQVGEPIQ